MVRVSDCVRDGIWLAVPQPTEWQRIGDQTRSLKLPGARVFVWREFIVRADENLTAFLELEAGICACGELARQAGDIFPRLPGYENDNTASSHGTHILLSGGCRT
jgi:hypothetical protein